MRFRTNKGLIEALFIDDAKQIMGFIYEDTESPNPDEMAIRGESAEKVEWAKQAVSDHKSATIVATLGGVRSTFVSLSFIAQPAVYHPSMDLDREKKEAYMCLDDGRIFRFDSDTYKVTSFDTQEYDPAHEGPEYVTPSLVALWQLADKARNRAADCLN